MSKPPKKLYITVTSSPLNEAISKKQTIIQHTVVVAETSGIELMNLVRLSVKHLEANDDGNA